MAENRHDPTPEETAAYGDRLRAELSERGVSPFSCPICGANAWGGFTDAALNVIEGRKPSGEVEGIAGSVHAVLASCGQCGFICTFDREVLGEFEAKQIKTELQDD